MLPPVINEGKIFPFKFWFNNRIQDGMYYRNELFYRLHAVPSQQRAHLYHYACKLARRNNVLITASSQAYSVWVSLRSPSAAALKLRRQSMPHFLSTDGQSSEESG